MGYKIERQQEGWLVIVDGTSPFRQDRELDGSGPITSEERAHEIGRILSMEPPVSVSKTAILADGVDAAVISSTESDATVRLPDGSLSTLPLVVTASTPGALLFQIESPGYYQDRIVCLEVIAVAGS